jgi:hypothetical protein
VKDRTSDPHDTVPRGAIQTCSWPVAAAMITAGESGLQIDNVAHANGRLEPVRSPSYSGILAGQSADAFVIYQGRDE